MSVAIAGNLCRVRSWLPSDADALVPLANDPYVGQYLSSGFPLPYTQAVASAWVRDNPSPEASGMFAIEADGVLAGGVGFALGTGDRAGTACVGYWLGKRFWGRGIGTEAVRTATNWAFATLKPRRVWAGVMSPNVASARVLEKAGYALEARLRYAIVDRRGAVHDELVYVRFR